MEDKITPTPVEATKNAIAAAIGDDTPAEQAAEAAPVVEKTADTPPENTVTEKEAEAAAKEAEKSPEAKVETEAEPEPEEDIDALLDKREPKIPAYRLKKKADQVKKAETKADGLERELEERDAKIAALEAKQQSTEDEDELEEEDEVLTPAARRALNEQGYVKKDEILAEVEAKLTERDERSSYRQQIRQDFSTLTQWAKEKGYPTFKPSEVVAFAEKEWGEDIVLTGKNLKAAYQVMHSETITDARVKEALAQAGKTASAEKPKGSAAPATPAAAAAADSKGWRDQVAAVVGGSE